MTDKQFKYIKFYLPAVVSFMIFKQFKPAIAEDCNIARR